MSNSLAYIDSDNWLEKRLIFAPINNRGEQVIDWITTENKSLIKLAAAGKTTYHRKIAEYIERVKPRPGFACCVISALGAYETWGQNINGDRFPRIMFQEGQHKTYEKGGFPYKHHLNKPDRGHMQYGDRVTLAEFNPLMDRVELIVWYDLSKDTDLLSDIECGNVGVSMGMKTPYDTCTIRGCGNIAKTPDQYCIHMHRELRREYGYYPGYIFPDGQQIGRWNRYANFFDISRVIIPAWTPGRIMQKVASAKHWNIPAEFLEGSAYLVKKSDVVKEADIVKQVPPLEMQRNNITVDMLNKMHTIQQTEPNLPNELLDNLAQKESLKKILSTMCCMGIVPKPREFQRIILVKTGQKKIADELEKIGCVFTSFKPSIPKNPGLIDISYENCSEKIAMDLEPYLKERSCIRPILEKRLEKIAEGQVQLLNLPSQNLIGKKDEKRKLSKEMVGTLAGIAGLYAILRGALSGGKPLEIGGKKLLPTAAEAGLNVPGGNLEKGFEKFMETSPLIKLMILAAIGGGALKAYQALKRPQIVGNYDQPLDTPPLVSYDNLSPYEQIRLRNQTPFVKIGAWDPKRWTSLLKGPEARTTGKTMMRALIGLPAAYMLAGTLEARRQANPFASQEPEGLTAEFLRKHPGIVAAGTTFAPQLKDVAFGLLKKSSVGEDVRDWALFGMFDPRSAALGVTGGVIDALTFNAVGKAFSAINKKLSKPKTQSINSPSFGQEIRRKQ